MSSPSEDAVIDPATRLALARLADSRARLEQRVEAAAQARGAGGGSPFQPRSATLRILLSLGMMKFRWLRLAVPAFMLLRSLRRR
jgi:hypothetical protein